MPDEPRGLAMDRVLVDRFKQGDQSAFDEMVTRYWDRIYAMVNQMLRNTQDAEEVTQDAFIRAHRGLINFRGESAFSTWLYQIARSFCIKERRGQHPTRSIDEDGAAELVYPTPQPDARAHARELGMEVIQIGLDGQFRCGGSRVYVEWGERLLGLAPGGPVPWTPDGRFDLSVSASPEAMEGDLVRLLGEGDGARMAAGYCWPWSDPRPDGSLVPDVSIGGWSRPWNLKSDRSVGGAPPSSLWATDPAGFGQVGCVYTAQGFEYEHGGVILGPDLVWREGGWVAVREANRDPDFRNRTAVSDADFDRLVRNVYKVLMTRGLRSMRLFSTDPETNTFLRSLVQPVRSREGDLGKARAVDSSLEVGQA